MKSQIDGFLSNLRGLDPQRGVAWTYYLDMLSVIEDHRDEIRHAEWPDGFDMLEAETYRGLLIKLEDDLRGLLTGIPLMKDEGATQVLDQFAGFFQNFMDRADAISEKLGGARVH